MKRSTRRRIRKQQYQKGGVMDIFAAINQQNIDELKQLLKDGVDVNKPNLTGSTPLFIASGKGNLEIVDLLLKNGADPNISSNIGKLTPLQEASFKGHEDIVNILLENKANPNSISNIGLTALYYAVKKDNINIIKTLLENGADPNIGTTEEGSPLYYACKNGKFDIVKALLENSKTNINIKNKNGETPLLIASYKGYTEIVKYLLEKGAVIDKNLEDLTHVPGILKPEIQLILKPSLEIPANAQNVISYENIQTNNIIGNIPGIRLPDGTYKYNSEFGRYYLKSTIPVLHELYTSQGLPLQNPSTKTKFNIKNVKYYRAKKGGSKRRFKKTRKNKL